MDNYNQFSLAVTNEFAALDITIAQQHQRYYGAGSVGKKWYSVGLESNDSDIENDNSAKKGIIRRMIDAVKKFIARIIAEIKRYFLGDPKEQDELDEFAKNYKGPTHEDLEKAVKRHAKENTPKSRSSTPDPKAAPAAAKAQPAKAAKAAQTPEEKLKETIENAERVTGQRIDVAKAEQFFNGEKMALISAMLSKDRMAVVSVMMDSEFNKTFFEASNLFTEYFTKNSISNDAAKLASFLQETTQAVDHCYKLISDRESTSEQILRSNLSKWVMGKDRASVDMAHSYVLGGSHGDSIRQTVQLAKGYLEWLNNRIEELEKDTSDDGLAKVNSYQQQLKPLIKFIALCAKIDSSYSTVLKGLRR